MALQLIPNEEGWLTVEGVGSHRGTHAISMYEKGGRLYLKFTVQGRNPGGGNDVDVELSNDQMHWLMLGAAQGLVRLGDDRGLAALQD